MRPTEPELKKLWVAEAILRRAAELVSVELTGDRHATHQDRSALARAIQRSARQLDLLEQVGWAHLMRGGFWRDLMRVAEVLSFGDRLARLREHYREALGRVGATSELPAELAAPLVRHDVSVFADYRQFYLWDPGLVNKVPEYFTDSDLRRMVKVAPNLVMVFTGRNTTVPVRLEIHAVEPAAPAQDWQHVVECSIDVVSGRLELHESTGCSVLNVAIAECVYRVRIVMNGLDTLSSDGLSGDDGYCLTLWPACNQTLHVARQWVGAG